MFRLLLVQLVLNHALIVQTDAYAHGIIPVHSYPCFGLSGPFRRFPFPEKDESVRRAINSLEDCWELCAQHLQGDSNAKAKGQTYLLLR